jgi:enamine deaminase RidA (YjgF/YER057c/UK114 family)
MADVVDVVASFLDTRDAEDVLEAARTHFPQDGPAWTLMGTQGFRRRGTLVELHAVAHLGGGEKQCFTPDSVGWMRKYPMSGACRKGEYLFVSGQMAIDLDGNVVNPGDHRAQSRFMFNRVKELVELAGGAFEEDVVDLLSFSVDPRSFDPMCIDVGCGEFLTMPVERAPSWSVIGSTALFRPGVFHTVRAICEIGNGPAVAYTPESIFWRWLPVSGGTKKADGNLLYVAGEVSMDRDGQIVNPGDFAAQARYAFNRIAEVLALAGGSMDNVVDLVSWHKDVRSIDTVLEVSREYFSGAPPAWSACGYPGGYFEGHLHEIYARAWIP